MAEKKKALNKAAESKNVDPNAELKGLKVFTKQSIEEKVRG
jgi:plasminogen activator inhibitor 1 RNA-binding protein